MLEAAKERISWTFDNFEKIYVSFSGGKDSTAMTHLVMEEAIKRNRKVGLLFIDWEVQYELTIKHVEKMYDMYKDNIEPYWVCLPIHLRNAVSQYETHWICWDKNKKDAWIREPPFMGITDENYFPFFHKGMEFEEFVPEFGEWYSQGKSCACLVGIRTDESLNRFRTIVQSKKGTWNGVRWTSRVTENCYNVYPIYDWRGSDIWVYHAKNPTRRYNRLYDLMHRAGVPLGNMRICQPYGDDQRKGLWLFHILEPETWGKIVARVNGANAGAMYAQESGNILGNLKITKPACHTWESFAKLLLESLPPKTREHFTNKISVFIHWWKQRGYETIPDEADPKAEANKEIPSWRRICKALLRNDYWCKGLSFSQHKSQAYEKYLQIMEKRRAKWGISL